MADSGVIRMGSADSPVVLDQYQYIIEVGWPGFDYAMLPVSVQYEWFAQNQTTPEGFFPQDWELGETCLDASRTVVEPQGELDAGIIAAHYLTGLRQHISFGTGVKLRRKRKVRNESGDVESVVEWVSATLPEPPFPQDKFGYPKTKSGGVWTWLGSTTIDVVNAAPSFEMYVRDIDGQPVTDKDGEVVYVEGAEPAQAPTGVDPIPFVRQFSIEFYMWGWPFIEGPTCTHFTGTANFKRLAAAIGGQEEFFPDTVNVSGLEVIIRKMKFYQVGMAMDEDSNIGILCERIPNNEEPSSA